MVLDISLNPRSEDRNREIDFTSVGWFSRDVSKAKSVSCEFSSLSAVKNKMQIEVGSQTSRSLSVCHLHVRSLT